MNPLTMSFRDFYESMPDIEDCVYVLVNPKEGPVYVGRSGGVWSRWFSQTGHLRRNLAPKGFWGATEAGRYVVEFMPESWTWKIEFYTIDLLQCMMDKPRFGSWSPEAPSYLRWRSLREGALKRHEYNMIRALHPLCNNHNNG